MITGKIISCAGILGQKKKEKQLPSGLFSGEWMWSIPQRRLKKSRSRAKNAISKTAVNYRSTQAGRGQEGKQISVVFLLPESTKRCGL